MTDPGKTPRKKPDRGRAAGKKRTTDKKREEKRAEKRDRYRTEAAALQERLAAEVERLTESDRWRQFLRFSRSFHTYSLRNLLLILAQKPDATRVAGYRQWLEKGRQVKEGEKSIAIFGYAVDKREVEDPQTGQTKVEERPWYPIRRVFDISQTELKPGAEDHSTITAQLEADDPAGIYDKVAAHMAAKGWTVARTPIRGEADGYTTMDGAKRIVVDANLSPADAAATMLHEAAHATLHADDPYWRAPDGSVAHRALAEVQAESVTYAIADMAGLDTSSYSVGYVAGWANGDPDRIRQAADGVLRGIRELAPAVLDAASVATEAVPADPTVETATGTERETEHSASTMRQLEQPVDAPALLSAPTPEVAALREHALAAAARGWHVFPLAPNRKTPGIQENWQEWATTDLERIEERWTPTRSNPGEWNIGIATGASGLLVVDLDQAKPGDPIPFEHEQTAIRTGAQVLADLEGVHGDLPATYRVATPSGGAHLYFARPTPGEGEADLGNSAGRLGWLIDTRGTGGYVVGAGSRIDGKPYRVVDVSQQVADLPAWMTEQLRHPEPSGRGPELPDDARRRHAWLETAIRNEVARVLRSAPHTHNESLFTASRALGRLVAAGELDPITVRGALLAAGEAVGQPVKEARATIESGLTHAARRTANRVDRPIPGPLDAVAATADALGGEVDTGKNIEPPAAAHPHTPDPRDVDVEVAAEAPMDPTQLHRYTAALIRDMDTDIDSRLAIDRPTGPDARLAWSVEMNQRVQVRQELGFRYGQTYRPNDERWDIRQDADGVTLGHAELRALANEFRRGAAFLNEGEPLGAGIAGELDILDIINGLLAEREDHEPDRRRLPTIDPVGREGSGVHPNHDVEPKVEPPEHEVEHEPAGKDDLGDEPGTAATPATPHPTGPRPSDRGGAADPSTSQEHADLNAATRACGQSAVDRVPAAGQPRERTSVADASAAVCLARAQTAINNAAGRIAENKAVPPSAPSVSQAEPERAWEMA